tara:strand:- start:103 stop:303 length:201 start_codon:yes stop_codon:yes gene_type:complete
MRIKGALGSVPVSLAMLNSLLKPNATVMVSKKFADSILMLRGNAEDEAYCPPEPEEVEPPISVETY